MSHIAHAELPWLLPMNGVEDDIPEPKTMTPPTLRVIAPLAGAMAISAFHLELRYGVKSDGLVVRDDAEIPGSIVVRPNRKLDHGWMVYSQSRKDVKTSDAPQMCEALLTLLLEVIHEKAVCSSEKSEFESTLRG